MSGYTVEATFTTRRDLTKRTLIQERSFVAERDAVAFARKLVYAYRAESAIVKDSDGTHVESFDNPNDSWDAKTVDYLDRARQNIKLAEEQAARRDGKVTSELDQLREVVDNFSVIQNDG